jgi:ribosome maturation factor RimP
MKDMSPVDRMQDATGRIEQVVRPILWSLGLDLVEISISGQGPRTIVRVFIDKPGGVTLDDCEEAHRSVNPALDVADPFPHAYIVEVSSPGLDRPLRRPEDFRRMQGKRISLKLREPHRDQWRVTGEIVGVEENAVTLALEEKKIMEMVRFEFGRIVTARLDVGF